jgi:hypothetical protein
MQLHELGIKYGTDKATFHNFCNIYEEKFKHLKDEKIEFLEIGIDNGFSLKMWADYFTNGMIYGADIFEKRFLDSEKIKTFQVNQANATELGFLPRNLDIIVDDGGHTMLQQQLSFRVLFCNNLKSNGFYVIEDLHTSTESYYNGYGSNEKNNTLKLLNDLKCAEFHDDNEYNLTRFQFWNLFDNIEYINIYENSPHSITSIIKKKITNEN